MHDSSGLRFDVYERVHLPQEAADIREIEEIELTPCVQAERQGDQVVLRGSLLLGGVYLPDDESRNSRQLEHWIPVEITLPQERVDRIEDLAVEVDNFDYDLLDGRTLNITGVLMLRGIRTETAGSGQQTYAWGEEPYTVVHRRERETLGESAGEAPQAADEAGTYSDPDGSSAAEREAAEWRLAGAREADDGKDQAGPDLTETSGAFSDAAHFEDGAIGQSGLRSGSDPSSGPVEWTFAAQAQAQDRLTADGGASRIESEQADEPEAVTHPESESEQGFLSVETGRTPISAEAGSAQEERPLASAARNDVLSDVSLSEPQESLAAGDALSSDGAGSQAASGKSDLRVAVGAKRNDESSAAESPAGLGKLFFSDRRETRGETALQPREAANASQAEDSAANAAHRQTSSDEVDWRSLFRGAAAQESFRTVRLCVVQKDDTLEAIALRYQRNPREIALVNRLDGSGVTEGQVLYIP